MLVRPRNPLNIGAVARAMANFGFSDLVAVEPYEVSWRQARSGVGAQGVLRRARAAPGLDEALRGCHLALGATSTRGRAPRRPVVCLPALGEFLAGRLPPGGRLALVFGSEKTGLAGRDLQRCRAWLRVPTRPEAPSMNLGQAAAVAAYELARASLEKSLTAPREPPPTPEQTEELVRLASGAFLKARYMHHMPEPTRRERLRSAFLRWNLTRGDSALLQGLFRRIP